MNPLIELLHVWVNLDKRPVLEDITLAIQPGDFYGIIGPNGGGKTTLLRVMLGLIPPSQGEVRVDGKPPEENRQLLGYVPQYRSYDFQYPLTVEEMILSGRLGHIPGPFRKYGEKDLRRAQEVMDMMGIAELAERPIGVLSGGQQQRAIIARALVHEPRALLLDEPTSHIDPQMEVEFYEILEALHDEMAIVLVTHDIGAVSTHVSTIGCLNRRFFTHGTREITEDMITAVYPCPVDLIAHGIPHRVLREHDEEER